MGRAQGSSTVGTRVRPDQMGGIGGAVGAGPRIRRNKWRDRMNKRIGAALSGSGKLSHLFGVTQLEFAAVARPADAAVTFLVLE